MLQPLLERPNVGPCRSNEGALGRSGEFVDFLAHSFSQADRAREPPIQLWADKPVRVLCASRDEDA